MTKATEDKKPGTEVAAPQNTAVADWKKELGGLAEETREAEKPSAGWISFRSARMSYGGNQIKDDKLKVVPIHWIFENQLYLRPYDPEDTSPPECYAVDTHEENLAPHPKAPKPQHATCNGCPMNQWKSDPKGGNGKACKNVRRIAVVAATDLGSVETVQRAEVAMMKIPVTSVKNWSAYATQVTNVLKISPLETIAELSVKPDNKTILQVNWELVDKITDQGILQALLAKRKEVSEAMFAGYDVPTDAPKALEAPATGPKKF